MTHEHDPTDIDESVIKGSRICGDCGAVPGAFHMPGCDVERCGACGGQAIACGCEDGLYYAARPQNRWTGVWPGHLEAEYHGLFCHDLIDGVVVTDFGEILRRQNAGEKVDWHVPCGKDDEGAHPDLNRWHRMGCPSIPRDQS